MAASPPPSPWKPRRFVPTWRFALWPLIALAVYAYGWKITEINLYELVVGIPKMQHIVLGLVQPDVITQDQESVSVNAPLVIGAASPAPSVATDGGTLEVSPGSGMPGDTITISGSSFPANKRGMLYLVDVTARPRPIERIVSDPSGSFLTTFTLPSLDAGPYNVRATLSWGLNRWYPSETFVLCLQKMIETLFLALMGTTLAVVLSIPPSFLGARNLMPGTRMGSYVYYGSRTFFNVLRSIEVMIVVVIMAVVVGIGPFAGVLALVVHSVGALGKLYSEAIETIDPGPMEAVTATGATRVQVVLFAVVPQVVPLFIAYTMYRWDINVRMSTVIGLVGGGGIGYILIQYINLLQWNQAGTAIWLIAIVVMALDYVSAIIRQRVT